MLLEQVRLGSNRDVENTGKLDPMDRDVSPECDRGAAPQYRQIRFRFAQNERPPERPV